LDFLSQLPLQQHKHAQAALEIAIVRRRCAAPLFYGSLDTQSRQSGVRDAEWLVQVIIGIMTFGLCVGESLCKILGKRRRRQWAGCRTGPSQELGHRQLDGWPTNFVQCGFDTSMGKGTGQHTPAAP
jgi:hypothetical protein